MGCSCGRNRNASRGAVRNAGPRPITSLGTGSSQSSNSPSPSQINALSVQANNQQLSSSGMTKARKEIERKRREAIRRRLGRA